MIIIEDITVFKRPIEIVFDAERNISLHSATQGHRGERAVDGVLSGLIEEGQEVEWEARHFGIKQRLRVRITRMEAPAFFRDELVHGAFKAYSHEHRFRSIGKDHTEKRDVMVLQAPLGPLGRLAEILFLKRYMTEFLRRKNRDLQTLLET